MTESAPTRPGSHRELRAANQRFFDDLWREARLIGPERFNTWPLVRDLAAGATRRLEVAPGLRPRLPIAGTHFADISGPALAALGAHGGHATRASITALPFPSRHFQLICALDIVEHVEDDDAALGELTRVATPDATFLLSIPLHPERWTTLDELVGHCRRYEPDRLLAMLDRHGLVVEQTAEHSMQPKSSRLVDFGMWFLVHRRGRAIWLYNHVVMPLALRFERRLAPTRGLVDLERADEILLVCRLAR
ncbi:MAG: methyltransferase domain-containing protein [Deltaproteobacteria bacterium]|nr:methyltransferase domain-containing protein [Deltaproteobacteria bacterium]